MKTLNTLLALLFTSITVFAQQYNKPGWLSVTLNSVSCQGMATDDALNFDGWGNEVYIVTFYSIANASGATKASWRTVSKVYGDVNRFPDRVKAGELNPDRVSGGLQKGSQFFPGEEYPHLKKVRVEATDYLTVIPTIWEWDNGSNSSLQAKFEERMLYALQSINLKIPSAMEHCYGFSRCYDMTNLVRGKQTFKDILKPLLTNSGNRPIGMSADGEYHPIAFTITGKLLQQVDYSSTTNYHALNYLEFTIKEDQLSNTEGKGAYWFRFHTRYEIDTSKPITAPPPARAENLVGKWYGTQTTDSGNYPQNIQFELTNNKEFIIMAGSALVSKGTYQFSNNQFTGSYKQLSSGETFSFNGTFDTATKKLSFTLGAGTSVTGQGKAVVSR